MSSETQDEVIYGEEPTAEQLELVAWGEETVRKGVSTAQDALKQMVTIATALLAGSTALLGQLPIPLLSKGIGSLFMLIALGLSLWGSIPREVEIDVQCPEEIKEARERGARFKMRCLRGSSGCLFLAFLVLVAGLLIQAAR